ncbi:peptide deformylase [bacterium (Candidatus Howlettbacteria) CG_4_10_14_0_8_um_filter_40_9]|nr:MAG: peptide deformylase [bacterium (Candidatus Howlettbacteria) CG_4_10_14_0_8_um_filter_40_9]
MAVKTIIEIGHPVLKLQNKPIVDFKSIKLAKLVTNLKDTMKAVGLIGIAAHQIGENYQVFLTQPRKTNTRNLGKSDILRVYINPQITHLSKETNLIYEGCGCVPNLSIFGPVIRPEEVEIEAFNLKGKKFRLRCNGILARVIQHEYDHLQGIEFLEKVTNNRKMISWKHYLEDIRNSNEQKAASLTTKIEFKKL